MPFSLEIKLYSELSTVKFRLRAENYKNQYYTKVLRNVGLCQSGYAKQYCIISVDGVYL